jgi:hypothetical protein
MHRLRHDAASEAWRLLRVLFLGLCTMPAYSSGSQRGLLQDVGAVTESRATDTTLDQRGRKCVLAVHAPATLRQTYSGGDRSSTAKVVSGSYILGGVLVACPAVRETAYGV